MQNNDKDPILKNVPDLDLELVEDSAAASSDPNTRFDPIESMIANLPEYYEVISTLGQGATGAVFKVRDNRINKIFAIKMLRPHLVDDTRALSRFQEEAKAAKAMTHVNLAAVFDYGIGKHGAPYLVMDYLDGKSLEKIIKADAGISTPRVIDLSIQIAEAIGHAHAKGLIHRDVKPSNIIIEHISEGVEIVKLVDFGIAKSLLGPNSIQRTRTGDIIGSPPYMAPEQCEGVKLDVRADIYSLGCVMYEMISGRPPFTGRNPIQIILKHIKDDPMPLTETCPNRGVTPDLNHIVMRCLQKQRWQRYESMDNLRKDLERVKQHKEISHFIPSSDVHKEAHRSGEKNTLAKTALTLAKTALTYAAAPVLGCIVGYSLQYQPTVNTPSPVVADSTPPPVRFDRMSRRFERFSYLPQPELDNELVADLGNEYLSQNRPEMALPLFQFAALDSGKPTAASTNARFQMGNIYKKLGYQPEALKAYKQASQSAKKLGLDDPGAQIRPKF